MRFPQRAMGFYRELILFCQGGIRAPGSGLDRFKCSYPEP